MSDCLFCKFANGEMPTDKVFENDDFIIIRDIEPKAENHFLAIPKRHFKLLAEATEEDAAMIGRMMTMIPKLGDVLGLGGGYRLVINQGDDAGQTVPHLHVHVLSGQKMGWTPA